MKANEVIIALAKNGNEKPVYVTVFHRDENGNVVQKETYPVNAVFSQRDDACQIYVERSEVEFEHC